MGSVIGRLPVDVRQPDAARAVEHDPHAGARLAEQQFEFGATARKPVDGVVIGGPQRAVRGHDGIVGALPPAAGRIDARPLSLVVAHHRLADLTDRRPDRAVGRLGEIDDLAIGRRSRDDLQPAATVDHEPLRQEIADPQVAVPGQQELHGRPDGREVVFGVDALEADAVETEQSAARRSQRYPSGVCSMSWIGEGAPSSRPQRVC
ncbi:MAG: hypothetical protein WDN24_20905 [Sphingomonas sp.]